MTFTIRRSVLVVLVCLEVVATGVFVSQRASAASATPVVYVATGENFPDALGAASAAAVQGGPVLLVRRDSIPGETKTELSRLKPDVIYVSALTAQVAALQAEVDALQAMLSGVSRNGDTLRFSGMNLQFVNGKGQTDSKNRPGNLVVGYNTWTGSGRALRDGSPYLVVGDEHQYGSWGGIVAGRKNTASGEYATVTGGSHSSILGG